jgi:hypothetical protein
MINITIDDRQVRARLDAMPAKAHSAILNRLTQLTAELEARVQSAEPARTGALRSETVESVRDTPERISGRVRVAREFAKAAALEYGAHGTVSVKSYQRQRNGILSRLMNPSAGIVQAYTRTADIAERRFLRGSLESMAGEIEASLRQAIEEALA